MTSNYDRQVDIGRKFFLQYDQEKLIKKYHPDNYLNSPLDYEKATKITISLTESLDRIKEWYSL